VRRWIREGRLQADTRRLIDAHALDEVKNEIYPTLPLPPEWQKFEDGTPAPNWVAAVALSRLGRSSSRRPATETRTAINEKVSSTRGSRPR
jgi:hypothetical protein